MDTVIIAASICFLVVMAYHGYRRGFVRILTSMLTLVAALFLTSVLVAPASKVVKSSTPIYDNITEKVEKVFSDEEIKEATDLNNLDIPERIKKIILESEAATNLKNETVKTVSDMIFAAGIYVVMFIVAYILVITGAKALDIVSRLPGVKKLNRIGGLVVGLIYGVSYLWVACVVVAMCSSMEWAQYTMGVINSNPVLSFIYEMNPLMILLTFFI